MTCCATGFGDVSHESELWTESFSLHRENLRAARNRMYKCFRFLGCLGLASVCNVSHGTPYPSPGEVRSYLRSQGGTGTTVTKAFKSVYYSED